MVIRPGRERVAQEEQIKTSAFRYASNVLDNRKALEAVIGAAHAPTGDVITCTEYKNTQMHLTITHKKPILNFGVYIRLRHP